MLLRLLYSSVAVPTVDRWAVDEILAVSRRNNARSDITGCLLFTGRHFAQFLQGWEEVVETAFERIVNDHRHTEIRTLHRGCSKLRLYHDATMGYVRSAVFDESIERLRAIDTPKLSDVDELVFRMRSDGLLGSPGSGGHASPARMRTERRRVAA